MRLNSKIVSFFKSSFDELVFQSRNKAFGAYQLRIVSRAGLVIGFIATLVLSFIAFSFFAIVKPRKTNPEKYVEYEMFDPNLKTTPLLKEPPKGEPNASQEKTPKKPHEKVKKPAAAKTSTKTVIDPKAQEEKILKEKARLDSLRQDSLATALADSLAKKKITDSLAEAAKKGQTGTATGTGSTIDTTQRNVVAGPTEFGKWLAEALRPKYTKDFKMNAPRGATFVLIFNVNSDSTLSDIKLRNKVYWGMDEIILETVRTTPKKWTPARNEKGEVIKSQPVMIQVKLHPYIGPKNN